MSPEQPETDRGIALVAPGPRDQCPAAVYVSRHRSETTRRTYAAGLRTLARELYPGADPPPDPESVPWHLLRYQHAAALRARLCKDHKPRTVNKLLTTLRGVVEECVNLGLVTDQDAAWRMRLHGERMPDDEPPAGRALEAYEVAALMAACDRSTLPGARDAAVVALLFGGGLRRAEAAGAHLANFDARLGRIRVLGKGRKTRDVQLAPDAADLVRAYVQKRGAQAGPLLVSFHLDGSVRRGRGGPAGLTAPGVRHVLAEIGSRAGVEDVQPHNARRTRITELLAAGEKPTDVKKISGHKSLDTLGRYDRTQAEAAHAASSRVPMVPDPPDAGG